MSIRAYTVADRAACLAIFSTNVPLFFAEEERADFTDYLDHHDDTILVAASADGRIVGVGGSYVRDTGEGRLAWGMVDRRWHGQGVGTLLLQARMAALAAAGVTRVSISTSPESRGFFERHHFRLVRVVPNGFGPGRDLVELERPTSG